MSQPQHPPPSAVNMKAAMRKLSTRKSYLDLTPVDVSLTARTNSSPSQDSPLRTPVDFGSPYLQARPPTAGGGPLSSHPATPDDKMPGEVPLSPEREMESESASASQPSTPRADSFRDQSRQPTPERLPQTKQPRRLFSLTNLRQSFASSRTSLRPVTSTLAPPASPSLQRPHSPAISYATTAVSNTSTLLQDRKDRAKSGSWLKRKSQIFNPRNFTDSESQGLGSVDEGEGWRRPETAGSVKRVKSDHAESAPKLPMLFEEESEGGEIGWDDRMFAKW